MENLTEWQGFDCLDTVKAQIDWKSVYIVESERQKRRFIKDCIQNETVQTKGSSRLLGSRLRTNK